MKAVGSRSARALARLERLASRPLGAALLFALALAAFSVRAYAWPLIGGRDLDEYLRYYLQIGDGRPLLSGEMLTHTPLTPIYDGLALDVAGGKLAEPLLGLSYALSTTAWAVTGRYFGPRVALGVAAVLLTYPAYGAMFHELSSEPLFATVFALWALLLTRAAARPSLRAFAAVGGGIAVLTLVRPGNQVMIAVALLPLLLPGRWTIRVSRLAVLGAAAIVPLGAWVLVNGQRYGEYTLVRGGNTALFAHALVVDRIVKPNNGPASRKLAKGIEEHLLTRDPYRAYGLTLHDVLSSGSLRVSEDIGSLALDVWGWNGGPAVLRDAGLEAVRAHPGTYMSNVLRTSWLELLKPYYRVTSPGGSTGHGKGTSGGSEAIVVRGVRLPRPTEGDVIPGGQNSWIARPDHAIRQVWTSPTTYTFVFATPEQRERFDQIQGRLEALFRNLPTRSDNRALATRLNQLERWYPPPVLWLVLGMLALALRRPARSLVLLSLAATALLVEVVTATVAPLEVRYLLPLAPALVLLGVAGVLGRRPEASGATAHASEPRSGRPTSGSSTTPLATSVSARAQSSSSSTLKPS